MVALAIQQNCSLSTGEVKQSGETPPLSVLEAKKLLAEMRPDAPPLSVQNPCFPSGFSETAHNLPEFSVDINMTAMDEK